MSKLGDEGRGAAECRPDEERRAEDSDEFADRFEEDEVSRQGDILARVRLFVVFKGACDDDGDSVVQNALAEDQRVQVDVDVQVVEDGETCDYKIFYVISFSFSH